jgi:hypothetical protein
VSYERGWRRRQGRRFLAAVCAFDEAEVAIAEGEQRRQATRALFDQSGLQLRRIDQISFEQSLTQRHASAVPLLQCCIQRGLRHEPGAD